MTADPSPLAAHLLLVDDDPAVRLLLSDELEGYGYRVTALSDGEQAMQWLNQHQADVLILDLQMQGLDGLQVMERLQQLGLPPAMIMLTAHSSLDTAVMAMRRGGCDFLSKPCHISDLLAAIERGLARRRRELERDRLLHLIEAAAHQLRLTPDQPAAAPLDPPGRAKPESPHPVAVASLWSVADLAIDLTHQTVTHRGKPVPLSPLEFRVLVCLAARPDEPLSFRELERQIHGLDEPDAVARDALRTTIWRLRKRLTFSDEESSHIVNVRGKGYMLVSNQPNT